MLKTLARWLAAAVLILIIAFALFNREGAGWRWLTKGGWHPTGAGVGTYRMALF